MPLPVVPWMTRVDRLVLEVLDEAGIAAIPPTAIFFELQERHGIDAPSKSQVNRRLRNELTHHGLVHQPFQEDTRGYYAITDLGERYFHDSDAEPAEFVASVDDSG
jgi:predicted transcriptional regulator